MPHPRIWLILIVLFLVPTLSGLPAQAGRKGSRKAWKLHLKKPKGRQDVGDDALLRLKVRNRTKEPRTARLVVSMEGSTTPVHEETLTLEGKEKRELEVPVTLPDEYRGRKLEFKARLEDDEDDEEKEEDETKVKVNPPADGTSSLQEWEQGRDLFLANCSGCHDATDREIRKEDLDDWLETVREGEEDEMPAFPELTPTEVRLMREYVLDPTRGDRPADDDAEWIRGRDLFLANCSGCHGEKGAKIRHEDLEEWREVVREGEDEMPSFPSLKDADILAMRKYVLDPDRVVNEPPPPPPPPPPAQVTYENAVKSILTNRCTACHNQSNAFGSVRLDTYADAFANRNALLDSVSKDRMPPSSPLGSTDKQTLKDWVDAGAPEK